MHSTDAAAAVSNTAQNVSAEAGNSQIVSMSVSIERLYQELSALIHEPTSVVLNTDYLPTETAAIYRNNAELFWAGVRGKRMDGHPRYRRPTIWLP